MEGEVVMHVGDEVVLELDCRVLVPEVVLTVSVVEEEGVTDVVESVLDDCATEVLVPIVELTDPTELVGVGDSELEPPDDGAETR